MTSRPIRIVGDLAFIPLTKGYEAIIDAADVYLVEGRNWRAQLIYNAAGETVTVYAVCGSGAKNGRPSSLDSMHRVVKRADPDIHVDHRDGDGLNNRQSNLRNATPAQNARNQRRSCNSTSGVKGVSWNARRGKWQAQIRSERRLIYLGLFDDITTASAAYDAASVKLFGAFARPNAQMEACHV